ANPAAVRTTPAGYPDRPASAPAPRQHFPTDRLLHPGRFRPSPGPARHLLTAVFPPMPASLEPARPQPGFRRLAALARQTQAPQARLPARLWARFPDSAPRHLRAARAA